MTNPNIAKIQDRSKYVFFTVTKPFTVERRGKDVKFIKGDLVGLREAASKPNTLRMIHDDRGETIIYSLDEDKAGEVRKKVVRKS